MEALNKKLDGLALLNQALVLSNETCEGGHTLWEYQTILDPPRKLRKQTLWGTQLVHMTIRSAVLNNPVGGTIQTFDRVIEGNKNQTFQLNINHIKKIK